MFNIQTRGIAHPNVVVGMALFCGGLAQLLAGMWEFPKGNTFGATAFTSYGVFWLSYATILLPGSGIVAAYTVKSEFESAVGIYLICWCMVTSYFCIVSFGKSISFIVLFFFLAVTFAVLAAGAINASAATDKAGGVLGVITAFVAYYIGVAGLLEAEPHPPFKLPLGELHQ
jgi:succinate-acetate transporter protein